MKAYRLTLGYKVFSLIICEKISYNEKEQTAHIVDKDNKERVLTGVKEIYYLGEINK